MSAVRERRGSLVAVGTGIRPGLQTTPEARLEIEGADKVLFLLDIVGARWIASLNASAESLERFYSPDRPRTETYDAMVEEILSHVRSGRDTCLALYGHPGVFVNPSHDAIARAREEGFRARMLPGVSAEDCLVADLGVDPGAGGLHAYEATEFLLHARAPDPTVQLVLWQIGAVGEWRARPGPNREALRVVADRLRAVHGDEHRATIYVAGSFPLAKPIVTSVRLGDLAEADIPALATLYVPPSRRPGYDAAVLERFARD